MSRINPKVLKWARETAGLSADEAASKIGLKATKANTALERLAALESGDVEPTRSLLEKMAKQYRRPLLSLYMKATPPTVKRGEDYRLLSDDHPKIFEALLDALIRDVRARQSMIRAVKEEEDEASAVPFVSSARLSDGVPTVVRRLRDALGLDLREFRAAKSAEAAFLLLRSAIETQGVFVLLIGDLGSHHTQLGVETFRGISLSDSVAPIVVINDQDSRAAWSFSAIHELTHICLGQSGISGAWTEIKVEKFCNDVASEFLLPKAEFSEFRLPETEDVEQLQLEIVRYANARNISSSMVAYRLFRKRLITDARWRSLRRRFKELWLDNVDRKRALNKQTKGDPSYYAVRQHRIGPNLIRFVGRMLESGSLTTSKAGRVLGVKSSNVHSLLDAAR